MSGANQWVGNGYDTWDRHMGYDFANGSISSQYLAELIMQKNAAGVSTQYSLHVQAGGSADDVILKWLGGAGGSTSTPVHPRPIDNSIPGRQLGPWHDGLHIAGADDLRNSAHRWDWDIQCA